MISCSLFWICFAGSLGIVDAHAQRERCKRILTLVVSHPSDDSSIGPLTNGSSRVRSHRCETAPFMEPVARAATGRAGLNAIDLRADR